MASYISGIGGPTAAYLEHGGSIWILLAAILIAYFIGNISPSIIMAKAKGIDIRKEGSGNAGTTNALRVMGKKAGVITLIVDILKGTAAVMIGYMMANTAGAVWCVLAVFCGHVWPVFFGFRGGKGVATAFGALLGLNPAMALLTLVIVVIAVLISKRMSVGSILGAILFPLIALFMERDFVLYGCVMATIILVKHRANIMRLIRGEEPVMSIFEKGQSDAPHTQDDGAKQEDVE